MKKILVIIVSFLAFSCTNEEHFSKGKKQLEAQGYLNVENNGYAAFCCDEKDTFSTGFVAKDKSGNSVEGCICSGTLKGITIRFK